MTQVSDDDVERFAVSSAFHDHLLTWLEQVARLGSNHPDWKRVVVAYTSGVVFPNDVDGWVRDRAAEVEDMPRLFAADDFEDERERQLERWDR